MKMPSRQVQAAVLDWAAAAADRSGRRYDVVLACDVLYEVGSILPSKMHYMNLTALGRTAIIKLDGLCAMSAVVLSYSAHLRPAAVMTRSVVIVLDILNESRTL